MLGRVAGGWLVRGLRPPHTRTHSRDATLRGSRCAWRRPRPMSRGVLFRPPAAADRVDLVLGLVNGPPSLDIGRRLAQPIRIVAKESEPAVALMAKKGPQFFRHIAMVDAEPTVGFLLANG